MKFESAFEFSLFILKFLKIISWNKLEEVLQSHVLQYQILHTSLQTPLNKITLQEKFSNKNFTRKILIVISHKSTRKWSFSIKSNSLLQSSSHQLSFQWPAMGFRTNILQRLFGSHCFKQTNYYIWFYLLSTCYSKYCYVYPVFII